MVSVLWGGNDRPSAQWAVHAGEVVHSLVPQQRPHPAMDPTEGSGGNSTKGRDLNSEEFFRAPPPSRQRERGGDKYLRPEVRARDNRCFLI